MTTHQNQPEPAPQHPDPVRETGKSGGTEWHPFDRPPQEDPTDTRLTFNDVLFGIVISQIFLALLSVELLRWSARVHLLLAFVVTLGSYIGYRKSLKLTRKALAFFNLPLIQFALDMGMIYLYYRLSNRPDLANHPNSTVSPAVDAWTVVYIFVLYLAWDGISGLMAKHKYEDVKFNGTRTAVTGGCLLLSLVAALFAWHVDVTETSTIVIDSLLIAIALLYRWLKDSLRQS